MSLMHRDATQWILLLGLPLAAGGMFVAGDVIALIYGPAYALSAIVLRVLVWLFFFTMLHTINIAGLIGSGNEKKYGTIMIVTAALYFVFVSLGALLFGPVGAALGVVVSEGASVVLCVRALRSIVPLKPPVHIFRIFGAVVLMALCIAAAGVQGVWQIMLAGSISYTVCIVLFRVVTWNDVRLLLARFV
jgi:O-antigen/teichoic acid export membrane protein